MLLIHASFVVSRFSKPVWSLVVIVMVNSLELVPLIDSVAHTRTGPSPSSTDMNAGAIYTVGTRN